MTTPASFVLSGPAGTLVAQGIRTGYDDIGTAAAALRDGTAHLIVGALPFDIRRSAALLEPMSTDSTLPPRPAAAFPAVSVSLIFFRVCGVKALQSCYLQVLFSPCVSSS